MSKLGKRAWEHFQLWLDWYGKAGSMAVIIIALGGAAIVNRLVSFWGNVHGIYLWIVSSLVFAIFLCTFVLAEQRLKRNIPALRSAPNLIFQVPTMGGLSCKAGVWSRGTSYEGIPYTGLNIPIKNEPLSTRPVGDAEKLKAQVIVTSGGVPLRESSPASWLGESSRTIKISVAETKELLVAFRGAGDLGYWMVEWDGIQLSYTHGEIEVRLLKEQESGWEIISTKLYKWQMTSGFPGLWIGVAD